MKFAVRMTVSIGILALGFSIPSGSSGLGLPAAQAQAANKGFDATFDKVKGAEQRIVEIRNELGAIGNSLKNAAAVIAYFDTVTRDFEEFRKGVEQYVPICNDRQRDYQKAVERKSPTRTLLAAGIQRCKEDLPLFEATLVAVDRQTIQIKRDIAEIKEDVSLLTDANMRNSHELKLNEDIIKLAKTLKDAASLIDSYKK